MIAIVDYRAGNITSVKRAVEHLGYASVVTCDPAVAEKADRIIVPGVGHFRSTTELSRSGMDTAVEQQVASGKPVLGICLGMQWLFQASTEAPGLSGLGVFAGGCQHFPAAVKSPHVGWNQIEIRGESRLLRGVAPGAFVYFTHSYCAPVVPETVATANYGGVFSAVVERGNLFGTQFHPEKSGEVGLTMLENFCKC